MKQIVLVAAVALLAGGMTGYVIRGEGSSSDAGPTMGDAMAGMVGSLEGKQGEAFDRAFLSEMVAHHEGALAMAELARTQAARPELKQLAEVIVDAQTEEIAQMQAWHSEWFGTPLQSQSHAGHGD